VEGSRYKIEDLLSQRTTSTGI